MNYFKLFFMFICSFTIQIAYPMQQRLETLISRTIARKSPGWENEVEIRIKQLEKVNPQAAASWKAKVAAIKKEVPAPKKPPAPPTLPVPPTPPVAPVPPVGVTKAKEPHAGSPTAAYLHILAPTRQQAYEKIKNVLVATDPKTFTREIIIENPAAFESLIDNAIQIEKQYSDYFALYHASAKEGLLLTLLRTYLIRESEGWTRENFFILRRPEFFYQKYAKSTEDYIRQNLPKITKQFFSPVGGLCINWVAEKCKQFDLFPPYQNHLISTSLAFVSGVDETSIKKRKIYEIDYAAWESSFYYFATNLSWSSVRRLFGIIVSELESYHPELFYKNPININIREYVAIKFAQVVDLLFPHARQKLGFEQELYAKAGMMIQFLIPKNIIDDVVYLAWANGILWQRTMNYNKEGWNEIIGAYTKASPILDILRTNPEQLGRSIHLLQARIVYKDLKYFYDPTSPIKMNLIHSLPESLFRSIKDSLQAIARVVVENSKALQNNIQQAWFDQSNIEYEVKRQEDKIRTLLSSPQIKHQVEGMNLLYYLVKIGTELNFAQQEANKHKNSINDDLRIVSNEILEEINKWQQK